MSGDCAMAGGNLDVRRKSDIVERVSGSNLRPDGARSIAAACPRARGLTAFIAAAVMTVGISVGGRQIARADDVLQGPHPFLKENFLSFAGGFSAAHGGAVGGLRAQLGYGYELLGSLWLDLQVGMVDGSETSTGGQPCASCGQSWDVMGGIAYRMQMNVPVIPYAKLDGGFIFLFPDLGARHAGLAARGAVGGKYFLYDWLGFGIELGALLGNMGRAEGSSRSSTFAALDLTAGVEWQF